MQQGLTSINHIITTNHTCEIWQLRQMHRSSLTTNVPPFIKTTPWLSLWHTACNTSQNLCNKKSFTALIMVLGQQNMGQGGVQWGDSVQHVALGYISRIFRLLIFKALINWNQIIYFSVSKNLQVVSWCFTPSQLVKKLAKNLQTLIHARKSISVTNVCIKWNGIRNGSPT